MLFISETAENGDLIHSRNDYDPAEPWTPTIHLDRNKRQTGEEFQSAGRPICRVIRNTNTAACRPQQRRFETGSLRNSLFARSVVSRIQTLLKMFLTPYWLAKISVIGAAILAFIGTYVLP